MPLLDKNAVLETDLPQRKHVIQVSEEAFYKHVALPVAPAVVHVGRNA